MGSFLIIANPHCGTRTAPQLAAAVCELLAAHGKQVDLRLIAGPGDARHLAREATQRGVRVVVGCGGDGTLREIANALEATEAALGVLPHGRCNDFARAIGLFRSDSPERLTQILIGGQRRPIDLGAVGPARFLTVATFGFASEVSRYVETHRLPLRGTLAYFYATLRTLPRYRPPLVRLRGDFGACEGRYLMAAIGNAPSFGGNMRITPGARVDSRTFEVCLVGAVSKFTVLKTLPRVMKGAHLNHPAVRTFQTTFLEIETPGGPEWICADGETLCQTPCRFEIRPHALRVVVPP